jgi:hypothetical protein
MKERERRGRRQASKEEGKKEHADKCVLDHHVPEEEN